MSETNDTTQDMCDQRTDCRCNSTAYWEIDRVEETEKEIIEHWRCTLCKIVLGTVNFQKEGDKNV